MIDRQQFSVRTGLEIETLEVWIKEEWLIFRAKTRPAKSSPKSTSRARTSSKIYFPISVHTA